MKEKHYLKLRRKRANKQYQFASEVRAKKQAGKFSKEFN